MIMNLSRYLGGGICEYAYAHYLKKQVYYLSLIIISALFHEKQRLIDVSLMFIIE